MGEPKKSSTKKIRVLLAEDHVLVRKGIHRFLQKEQSFEVVGEAGDGEELVALTKELQPDVIVTDVAMPRMSGIQAIKQIKATYPSIAVLILTAYDYDQYVFALLEAGASGYLLKDICPEELVDAIHAVHKGNPILHPTVARKVMERFRSPANGHEPGAYDLLSDREMHVLALAAKGRSNKDIADELSLSIRTIETHIGHIFNKLGVGSRTEAVIMAIKRGWVSVE
ncbi:MAG: response regulator transcription factor [Actinomycetota bacterium]|nr:response regulator transcription factor [Actinomycetota bacterium]